MIRRDTFAGLALGALLRLYAYWRWIAAGLLLLIVLALACRAGLNP